MQRTGRLASGAPYHGMLLIGYRLFDRATVGTPIDKVMRRRWFVPFSVGLNFACFVLSAPFFRAKTLRSSGYVLSALFGFQHVRGEFLLTTGTIVLLFISLFFAVAQERNQFIDPWRCNRRGFKSQPTFAHFSCSNCSQPLVPHRLFTSSFEQ